MKTFLRAFLAAASLSLGFAGHAHAADMIYGVHPADPDACVNDRVLSRISDKFRYQVTHVPHLPDVSIVAYSDLRLTRYEPRTEDSTVERRYCRGSVALSNGDNRHIWYLIEVPLGFAGLGSNVEACILGYDRWYVYGGNCRVLY